MRLFLDYTTKGKSLYDYQGHEFLSANDAYDFAETAAHTLKNELNSDWQGWCIEVRNAAGQKYFSVPIDAIDSEQALVSDQPGSEAQPYARADREMHNPACEPASLLIIEDALIHSAVIDRMARKVGYIAFRAHNYEEACAAVKERRFDCITLDLGLGPHVGLDVLRHLAAIQCRAPIIVISQSDKETCDDVVQLGRALDLNVCEYVQKPIDVQGLRRILEHVRAEARAHDATS